MKILSFGEIIWDVYPDKECIGGAPLNFAAHSKRAGAEAYLMSAIGDDGLGKRALELAVKYGVRTDYVAALSGETTGQCRVSLSDTGVPTYNILENVAYDKIPYFEGLAGKSFDAVCFGTLALRESENRKTLERLLKEADFGEIFADINLRAPFYSKESIDFCLRHATVLKVSDEELPFAVNLIFGFAEEGRAALEKIAKAYPNIKLIILTCGGDGSAAYDVVSGNYYRCAAKKTEVVSTVGAGDSYGATFLVKYLEKNDIESCLNRAAEVSAFVVSRAEAIPEC